jgi:hypothetical protein
VTVDRRPMGSGSIESRNGRHRVRLRVGGKKQTLGTYPTRERAEAVLSAALEQLEGTVSGSVTLRGWVATWLEQRAEGQEVRSTTGDASRLRTHALSEPWADDPIETISRPMVQAWARELLTRPAKRYVGGAALQDEPRLAELGRSLSRTTAGHALRALRVCFRDALEAGLVTENPCIGVRLPRVARLEDPSTYLTTEEIAALLGCDAVPIERRQVYWVGLLLMRWSSPTLEGACAGRTTPPASPRRSRPPACATSASTTSATRARAISAWARGARRSRRPSCNCGWGTRAWPWSSATRTWRRTT